MNQSLKSILALLILICLGASFLGWTTKGHSSSKLWMELSGLLVIPSVALLYWADFRKDKVADHLIKISKSYHEQNGLCFIILPEIRGDEFFWKIYYQNRYSNPCMGTIAFRPAVGSFRLRRPKMDEARSTLECEGSGFASIEIPYSIGEKYLGKKLTFEVMATISYPEGKGEMVRFRDGLSVARGFKTNTDSALTLIFGLFLIFYSRRPGTFTVQLPRVYKSSF